MILTNQIFLLCLTCNCSFYNLPLIISWPPCIALTMDDRVSCLLLSYPLGNVATHNLLSGKVSCEPFCHISFCFTCFIKEWCLASANSWFICLLRMHAYSFADCCVIWRSIQTSKIWDMCLMTKHEEEGSVPLEACTPSSRVAPNQVGYLWHRWLTFLLNLSTRPSLCGW